MLYCIRTNIGKELNLVIWRIAMQSPSLNLVNVFFYSISILTLVAFRQTNISPNPLFQQIAKYYIHQYLFLYGIMFCYHHLFFIILYKGALQYLTVLNNVHNYDYCL